MERKLSQKATRIRRRFTFSRNNRGRNRASTMNASAGATYPPNSRPRSSTIPVSSNPSENAWDNTEPRCVYDFTDEPGYFRPASPFIDRQEIEEDLADEMKHACAMLVHSIERGLPMWPSFPVDVRPSTGIGGVDQASVPGTQSECQYQGSHVLSRDSGDDINAGACGDLHDSGVAFSNRSSAKLGRSTRNSLTSSGGAFTGTGRFYGNRSSTSPPQNDAIDSGRARGQSLATDIVSVQSRSRSRSRYSSPALFPYSPPQIDAHWIHTDTRLNAVNLASSDEHLAPDTHLGEEGITWLRASLDRRLEHDSAPQPKSHDTSAPPLTDPQPRRFYSTRRLPSEKIFHPQEWAYEIPSSRNSSFDAPAVRSLSLSFDREKRNISTHDWALRDSRSRFSSSREFDDDRTCKVEPVHTVIDTGTQPRRRRRGASHLLMKLVGIRRREEEEEVDRTVVVAG